MPNPKKSLPKSLTKKLEKHGNLMRQILSAKAPKQRISVINLSSKSELLFLSRLVIDFRRKFLNETGRAIFSDKVARELENSNSEIATFCDLNHKSLEKDVLFDSFILIINNLPTILKQVQVLEKRASKNETLSADKKYMTDINPVKGQTSPKLSFSKEGEKIDKCPNCSDSKNEDKIECQNLKKTVKQLHNCDCKSCSRLLSKSKSKERKLDNVNRRSLLSFYEEPLPAVPKTKITLKTSKAKKSKIEPKNSKKSPSDDENQHEDSEPLPPINLNSSSDESDASGNDSEEDTPNDKSDEMTNKEG